MKKMLVVSCLIAAVVLGCGVFMINSKNADKVEANQMEKQTKQNVTKQPSTVVGKLDIVKLYMEDKYSAELSKFVEGREERIIRIWVPKTYDPNDTSKRYPVLYMHDGQNVFDDYTSYCGEWGVDETITAMMENEGYEGSIVVGIDNSPYREPEMKPAWEHENSLADRYSDFIINTVKPYVDANYNTLTDAKNTGIGGSSMGGLISFYMGLKHPEVFGYELCFAPGFCFVTEEQVKNYMEKHDIKNKQNPKIYMFCGGQDLDAELVVFVDPIKNVLLNNGYDNNLITSCIDMSKGHNERAWREYFGQAYKWVIDFNK